MCCSEEGPRRRERPDASPSRAPRIGPSWAEEVSKAQLGFSQKLRNYYRLPSCQRVAWFRRGGNGVSNMRKYDLGAERTERRSRLERLLDDYTSRRLTCSALFATSDI